MRDAQERTVRFTQLVLDITIPISGSPRTRVHATTLPSNSTTSHHRRMFRAWQVAKRNGGLVRISRRVSFFLVVA
jgi:hypothetical protein